MVNVRFASRDSPSKKLILITIILAALADVLAVIAYVICCVVIVIR